MRPVPWAWAAAPRSISISTPSPSTARTRCSRSITCPRRSRRQKGLLAFLARDADHRVFCYANAEVRKADQNDEILRFVEFWKERTGQLPAELIFYSKLTTYRNLHRLNQMGVAFITLRRRDRKLLEAIRNEPPSAWRRIELPALSRAFRTPRILDRPITLSDYPGPLRQITATDLGHEEPTLLLTNQLTASPVKLLSRYAQRMLIENGIQDGVDFFHMDALSSAVAMKINCDLQLSWPAASTASSGHGLDTATKRRNRATSSATWSAPPPRSPFDRAHDPLLIAAGFRD